MCLIHARYAARGVRTLLLCYIFAAAFDSYSAHAADTKESLVFYPPFSVVEIANRVQERQDALRVAQFRTMIGVQYGRRIEWINACAWLKAQTAKVMIFYKPPQNGSAEYHYFCGVSKVYREASDDSLSDLHTLINELTRQFGGATTSWNFDFREYLEHENDTE